MLSNNSSIKEKLQTAEKRQCEQIHIFGTIYGQAVIIMPSITEKASRILCSHHFVAVTSSHSLQKELKAKMSVVFEMTYMAVSQFVHVNISAWAMRQSR